MAAGQELVAGRYPGERIATSPYDSDSTGFTTTETEVASVTAALVTGRTYRVRLHIRIGTSAANDIVNMRIRQDTTGGAEMTVDPLTLTSAGVAGNLFDVEVEHTASATGNKTFVATAQRTSGSGTIRREAAANRPTYLYVDYIRG